MRRGYSLLELIVVITLIGIIVAVGSVRFSGVLTDYKTEQAATMLLVYLKECRAAAAARGRTITLTGLKNNSNFTITGMENPNHPGKPYVVDLATWTPDVTFKDNVTFRFNGFGSSIGDTDVEIKARGISWYVNVDRNTAVAKVSKTKPAKSK